MDEKRKGQRRIQGRRGKDRRGGAAGKIRSYRDLYVWQKSYALALRVYAVTQAFPKNEQFGLTGQMRRASVSVVANIAEGYGRGYRKDYAHFLRISYGSLMELETLSNLSADLGYIRNGAGIHLSESISEEERMLNRLIMKVEEKIR